MLEDCLFASFTEMLSVCNFPKDKRKRFGKCGNRWFERNHLWMDCESTDVSHELKMV